MKKVQEAFDAGGVVVYPTDSGYSMGCDALSRKAVNKLYHLKRDLSKYLMALMGRDFSALSDFAKVDTAAYRYMKHLVPGPYTFILPSTLRARKVLDANRPEVGIRMPKSAFTDTFFSLRSDAVLLTTAAKVSEDSAILDPEGIEAAFGHAVDLIVDMGPVPLAPTTVIQFGEGTVEVLRQGAGPVPGNGGPPANPYYR
jgi:tRNA threonylcarbamoyl adenosine modification protein (Sua5/YciO/YrdC/YwlC family)